MPDPNRVRRRHILQWALLWIVVVTIAFGWKYPWLGFSVPLVMGAGLVGGLFRGRWVCGNLCPRGSFFDRVMPALSRKRRIPAFLRNRAFRWFLFALMMGFMMFRASANPTDPMHWGRVFWLMCVITTGIGLVLGVLIHPRAWCSFCPMGTMQSEIGGRKHQLSIDSDACVQCRKCERVCPFGLDIVDCREAGRMTHPDCLRCLECVAACPKDALKLERRAPRAAA
ncbi:MAG: 4Fe-4S binding protein [Kiritimatiellae bacterium]|nr:4Fe-4S binding protein [Kiritimatiellia bacterium]